MKAGEKCPGEDVCTTDVIAGRCARTGRTLEDYCHEAAGGCDLYFTKAGVTPLEFRGMMQAVYMLRARQNGKLDLYQHLYPYWAEQAYMLGNQVFSQVESEKMETDEDNKPNQFALTGKGDSGAFSAIYEYMNENRLKPRER